MSRQKIRKKTALPMPAKAAIVVLVTILMLFLLAYAVTLACVRSADAGFREKLCGTMAERGRFYTDWFFTGKEIERATAYEIPTEIPESTALPDVTEVPESDTYVAAVYEVTSGGLSLQVYDGKSGAGQVCIGLARYPGMVFTDGTLYHTAEADYEKFCFCGMSPDGTLHVGAQSPLTAVNSGYLWGIACERVLVSGGVPCADLRGGYGVRAAIGQRADGSLFLLVVTEKKEKLYPRGITYDMLARLAYAQGAVTAAALPVAEELSADGKVLGAAREKAGYVLTAELATDGKGQNE